MIKQNTVYCILPLFYKKCLPDRKTEVLVPAIGWAGLVPSALGTKMVALLDMVAHRPPSRALCLQTVTGVHDHEGGRCGATRWSARLHLYPSLLPHVPPSILL